MGKRHKERRIWKEKIVLPTGYTSFHYAILNTIVFPASQSIFKTLFLPQASTRYNPLQPESRPEHSWINIHCTFSTVIHYTSQHEAGVFQWVNGIRCIQPPTRKGATHTELIDLAEGMERQNFPLLYCNNNIHLSTLA